MSGTVHGLVNKQWGRIAPSINGNQMPMFKAFAAFFDHLCTPAGGSYMTRVASRGSTWNDLQSTDYTQVAFGVWKMKTSTLRPGGGSALGEVYILLATAGGTYINSLSGLRSGGADGQNIVGMSIAFREDGGNPWNGGTDNDGADEINTQVWTAGASTLHCFPHSNNPGGGFATNRNDTLLVSGYASNGLYYIDIPYGFLHGVADADNFAVVYSAYEALRTDDDPKQFAALVFGLGDVMDGVTADPFLCYAWVDGELPIPLDPSGFGSNSGGVKKPGSTVGYVYFHPIIPALDAGRQPNPYLSGGSKYDESAMALATDNGAIGWAHEPSSADFWRLTYGPPNEGYDATSKRAAFGPIATASTRITIPWPDSIGEAPGGSRTLAGVGF